eukprot:9901-Pelagomonas_calceolata.AAC.2
MDGPLCLLGGHRLEKLGGHSGTWSNCCSNSICPANTLQFEFEGNELVAHLQAMAALKLDTASGV